MAEHPKGWNRRIVSALHCGCVESVTTYEGVDEINRITAIINRLERGYVVHLVAWDDIVSQEYRCANYPHEQWQIDYQRRRLLVGDVFLLAIERDAISKEYLPESGDSK